jgi:hypothetical protein
LIFVSSFLESYLTHDIAKGPPDDFGTHEIITTLKKDTPGWVTVGMEGSKTKDLGNDKQKEEVSQLTRRGIMKA